MEDLFAELNYPSAPILKRALKARGIPFTNAEVDRLVKSETVRQVQAPSYAYTGKVVSRKLNDAFFADLIDFTAVPSDGGKKVGLKPTEDKEKYVLVLQRIFDRKLWAVALTSKRPEAVAEAFEDLLRRVGATPRAVTTDLGAEFGQPFQRVLTERGIAVRTKDKADVHGLSTLDVAIGHLKKALARVARRRQTNDWADILAEVVRGQNAKPSVGYLDGHAANDVESDEELTKELEEKNTEFAAQNRRLAGERAVALAKAGHFRVQVPPPGRLARGWKPKWSDEVHAVEQIDGSYVWDEAGNRYPTKFTKPVSDWQELPPSRIEQGGSEQTLNQTRSALEPVARAVRSWMGLRRVTLQSISAFLRTWDFPQLALQARLPRRNPVISFLRTFPELFEVFMVGDTAFAKGVAGPPAFEGARRLRRIL